MRNKHRCQPIFLGRQSKAAATPALSTSSFNQCKKKRCMAQLTL